MEEGKDNKVYKWIAPRLGPFEPVAAHPKLSEAPEGYYDFTEDEVVKLGEMRQKIAENDAKRTKDSINPEEAKDKQ